MERYYSVVRFCFIVIVYLVLQTYLSLQYIEPLQCDNINTSNPVDWHLSRVEYINPYSLSASFCYIIGFQINLRIIDNHTTLPKYYYHYVSQTLILGKLATSNQSLLLVYEQECHYIPLKSGCLIEMNSIAGQNHQNRRTSSLMEDISLFWYNALIYSQFTCFMLSCILICVSVYHIVWNYINHYDVKTLERDINPEVNEIEQTW